MKKKKTFDFNIFHSAVHLPGNNKMVMYFFLSRHDVSPGSTENMKVRAGVKDRSRKDRINRNDRK